MELAVCCDDVDCPLRTVKPAMGTPGCFVTDIEGNDFSCRSYGLDRGIARSPVSEKSFTGDFSMINYPAERMDDDMSDVEDDMMITRSDLYADTVAQPARTQTHFDNPNNFPSQRPRRNIRQPARYDNFQAEFTQSQHVRRIKLSLPLTRLMTQCKQTRNKEVKLGRNDRLPERRKQCRVPAAVQGYINPCLLYTSPSPRD